MSDSTREDYNNMMDDRDESMLEVSVTIRISLHGGRIDNAIDELEKELECVTCHDFDIEDYEVKE